MKFCRKDLMLYAIADWDFYVKNVKRFNISFIHMVQQAIFGGVRVIQFRAKSLRGEEFLKVALECRNLCRKYGVFLIVNDEVNVGLEIGADGVHVGQNDLSLQYIRKTLKFRGIVGVSVKNLDEALKALEFGADYLGVGAIFKTDSKIDAKTVTIETLKEICNISKIPVVAIGGINRENILKLRGIKISGVALISAIFLESNIFETVSEFFEILRFVV